MGVVISLAFVALVFFFLLYQRLKRTPGSSRGHQIAVKCAATSMAALVALLGCLRIGAPAHWLLFAGLIICTIADGVICVYFLPGGAIFVLGHIMYMISFWMMHRPDWRCLLLLLCLMGVITIGINHLRVSKNRGLIYAYAAVLSLMVSLAAFQTPLILAGALLFAFSDGLLGYLAIKGDTTYLDYISLGAYYLGQFLLALGTHFY